MRMNYEEIHSADSRLTRLIIGCHKDKSLLEEPPATPYDLHIQAGAALTDVRNYPVNDYDDFPESISNRNDRYSEMTAIYWARHHLDTPYIGIEHYRRRFEASTESILQAIDNDVDVITLTYATFEKTLEDYLAEFDFVHPYRVSMDIIREFHPEDYDLAVEIMHHNVLHPCNMNIWKKELFYDYCEWLFPMLDAFYTRITPKRDHYLHRDVGFFAERATSIYIEKLEREGKNIQISGVCQYQSVDAGVPTEDHYSSSEELYAALEALYAARRTIDCHNQIVRVALTLTEEERYQCLLYIRIFDIYKLERLHCPLSLFEYLPEEYRSTLDRCSQTVSALQIAIEQVLATPSENSETVLIEVLAQTHFSAAALCYLLFHFFSGEANRDYILMVLSAHSRAEMAQQVKELYLWMQHANDT